jgi:N-acetylglutamate synthase-like GNAT family acetyltransferase
MASARQIRPLTRDNLAALPSSCVSCTRWELDAVHNSRAERDGTSAAAKAHWLSTTLLDWGSCGHLIYSDDHCVGFVTYAPPAYLPGFAAFATTPLAADAVGLATLYVRPEYRCRGLGRILIQSAAADVARRGIRAIEVVASETPHPCMVPAEFLRAVGFSTVRPHPVTPRLRLDLKSTSWREEVVEATLGRLRARRSLAVQRQDLN